MSVNTLTTMENDPGHARPAALSPRARVRFEALQHTLVPSSAAFDVRERTAALTLVARALSRQPAAVRRQLALLLAAIDGYCLLRHGRVFRRLDAARRRRTLERLSTARWSGRLRQGIEGLTVLARLGVYGQTALHPRLGYRLREVPRD